MFGHSSTQEQKIHPGYLWSLLTELFKKKWLQFVLNTSPQIFDCHNYWDSSHNIRHHQSNIVAIICTRHLTPDTNHLCCFLLQPTTIGLFVFCSEYWLLTVDWRVITTQLIHFVASKLSLARFAVNALKSCFCISFQLLCDNTFIKLPDLGDFARFFW